MFNMSFCGVADGKGFMANSPITGDCYINGLEEILCLFVLCNSNPKLRLCVVKMDYNVCIKKPT